MRLAAGRLKRQLSAASALLLGMSGGVAVTGFRGAVRVHRWLGGLGVFGMDAGSAGPRVGAVAIKL